ncbi:sorting nexin-29-like [Macrotis lagotis]|uniref:sorting nexin-29-like n=1 Tax=Macrotis lagotis TaxID=92651 RepID=UPI003D69EEDF
MATYEDNGLHSYVIPFYFRLSPPNLPRAGSLVTSQEPDPTGIFDGSISNLDFALGNLELSSPHRVFWYYVKEVLNKHELQPFYSLRNISTDVGRGRAWLRCALNEHSLERYIHMLLADRIRLSIFYEDWAFVMDEERSSMFPTMAAGLNSILFAINIDNKDLNGQSKYTPTVSDLLKESTQNMTSLLKESTQGVSSLLQEITASSAVSILIKPDQESDPLPVVSRNVSVDVKCKKDRKKKKKVTNIISFDDEEEEQNFGDIFKKTSGTGESSEENSDRSSVNIMSTFESSFGQNSNGSQSSNSWKIDSVSFNGEFGYQKLDVKSIDDEDIDENEDEVYGKHLGKKNWKIIQRFLRILGPWMVILAFHKCTAGLPCRCFMVILMSFFLSVEWDLIPQQKKETNVCARATSKDICHDDNKRILLRRSGWRAALGGRKALRFRCGRREASPGLGCSPSLRWERGRPSPGWRGGRG